MWCEDVLWWTVAYHVGYVDIKASKPCLRENLVQYLTSLAHEGTALSYLMFTGVTSYHQYTPWLGIIKLRWDKGHMKCPPQAISCSSCLSHHSTGLGVHRRSPYTLPCPPITHPYTV